MRAALGLCALLAAACGGAPIADRGVETGDDEMPIATAPYGWLPTPALEATVWPREVEAADRLVRETLPALLAPARSLAEAWTRAWQQWADLAAEPAVPGVAGRTLWGRWGLAADRPIRLIATGVEGPRAGRALMRALEAFQQDAAAEGAGGAAQGALDEALESAPVADVQVRLLLETTAPERLTEALRFHLERRGFEVFEIGEAPPPFVRGAALPGDAVLVARSTRDAHVVLLRGTQGWRAIDWVSAVSPRVPLAALLRRAVVVDASPPPTPVDSRLVVHLPGVALLELALATSQALRALEAPDAAPGSRGEMLLAATNLAAACSDRWRRLARLAFSVDIAWRAGEDLVVEAASTAHGLEALRRATGPLLLDPAAWARLPLSAFARFRRVDFLEAAPEVADLPASPFALWDEAGVCAAGHPLTALATVAVGLPAADIAEWVPAPVPGELTLLGARPAYMAAAVLGGTAAGPDAGPRIGLAAVAEAGDFPRDATPLGETAKLQVMPSGPRFVLGEGPETLAYERRDLGRGREAAFLAFGDAALPDVLAAASMPVADGPLAAIALDAAGLQATRGLTEDTELKGVLSAWAAHGRVLRLEANVVAGRLVYRLSGRSSGPRDLEPRTGAR